MLQKVLWAMGVCAFIAIVPVTVQAGERVYERSYSHSESSYTRIVERTSCGSRMSRCEEREEPRPCARVPYRCERVCEPPERPTPCRRNYNRDQYPVEEQRSRMQRNDDDYTERYQPRQRYDDEPQDRGSYRERERDRNYDDRNDTRRRRRAE